MEHVRINLDAPLEQKWLPLEPYIAEGREVCQAFAAEAGMLLNGVSAAALQAYAKLRLPRWFNDDVAALAELLDRPKVEVLIANLYYDGLKIYFDGIGFGCSAVAVEKNGTIIHARNLDWPSEDNVLSRTSIVIDYARGGQVVYSVVAWPGYTSALSGVAHGKFSVTLNAVTSDERGSLTSIPVSLLIKGVLENEPDFDAAVEALSTRRIMSDCLLLVAGTEPGERVVIERTPRYYEHRHPASASDPLVVTNHYVSFTEHQAVDDEDLDSELSRTACSRYERLKELASNTRIRKPENYIRLLKDEDVIMDITAQHMVFCAAESCCHAEKA